jgi:hypothetical protein
VLDLPARGDRTARLVDFANAGATGRRYQSWLPASHAGPPKPVAWRPADGAAVAAGPIRFTWRKPAAAALADRRHTVVVSDSPAFERIILRYGDQSGDAVVVPAAETSKLRPGQVYYWKIVARNGRGEAESIRPYKQFTISPTVSSSL